MSSKNQGENIVKNEKQSIITQQPQKKQKLPRAGELDREPMKKDRPSVTDVIVMEGPAWVRPILNLSFAVKQSGVQSIVLTITNMSSTPSPRIKKGSTACISENLQPRQKEMPQPDAIEMSTQLRPITADVIQG